MSEKVTNKEIAAGLIDGMRAEVVRLKRDQNQDVELYVTVDTLFLMRMYYPNLIDERDQHWIAGLRTHIVTSDQHPPFRAVAVDMAHKKGA